MEPSKVTSLALAPLLVPPMFTVLLSAERFPVTDTELTIVLLELVELRPQSGDSKSMPPFWEVILPPIFNEPSLKILILPPAEIGCENVVADVVLKSIFALFVISSGLFSVSVSAGTPDCVSACIASSPIFSEPLPSVLKSPSKAL